MYSPLMIGRIQLPVECISQTTSASRGSPLSKKGSAPNCHRNNVKHTARRNRIFRLSEYTEQALAADSWFTARSATNVLFIPSLKNKQGPEGLSIIFFSCELFVNELLHVGIMKDTLPLYCLLAQVIQHESLQLPV